MKGNFQIATDNAGGTLLTDPPVSSGPPALLVNHMASAFASSVAAPGGNPVGELQPAVAQQLLLSQPHA